MNDFPVPVLAAPELAFGRLVAEVAALVVLHKAYQCKIGALGIEHQADLAQSNLDPGLGGVHLVLAGRKGLQILDPW